MDEIVFASSNPTESKRIGREVGAGRLRKLVPRVYTSNFQEDDVHIVRRNLHRILGKLFPGSVISHSTGLLGGMPHEGRIYLTYPYTRRVNLPGVTVHALRGPGPQEGDTPYLGGLYLASRPRALLENMQPGRPSRGSKILPRAVVEAKIEEYCRIHGEAEVNRLRDDARRLAATAGMQPEFEKLNGVFSAILGTGEAKKLTTSAARARAQREPFDSIRVERFTKLASHLISTPFAQRKASIPTADERTVFAFFEAYFSNFIEGTEFPVEEAREIIFENKVPEHRPKDAHDIIGTYRLIADPGTAAQIPATYDELIDLLCSRHYTLMEQRPEVAPGRFKERPNVAGNSVFVAPDLVRGTLRQGFELMRSLIDGFGRAVFLMFLLSEVHPFNDGNGRISRIFMNAELTHLGLQRIIIPTVFREDYTLALKALTQNDVVEGYPRMMDRAQEFSGRLALRSYDACLAELHARNAFRSRSEARLRI